MYNKNETIKPIKADTKQIALFALIDETIITLEQINTFKNNKIKL